VVSSIARGSARRTDASFPTEESRMDTVDGRIALITGPYSSIDAAGFRPLTETSRA